MQDPVTPTMGELLNERELLKRLRTISRKKLYELRQEKLIPVIRLGHRTLRYNEAAVRKAIARLTTKEVEVE
jgi:transposase